jgi:hypothetical protein
MRSTLCKFFLVPAIAAAAALVSHSTQAQTVDVPFTFTALGQNFPAGTYVVQENRDESYVTLRLKNGGKSICRVVGPGDPDNADRRVVLRFREEGDAYTLDTIQFGPMITSHLAPGNRHNRELAARLVVGQ